MQWGHTMFLRLYSIYSLPNTVLPLAGGVFVDRIGVTKKALGYDYLIFNEVNTCNFLMLWTANLMTPSGARNSKPVLAVDVATYGCQNNRFTEWPLMVSERIQKWSKTHPGHTKVFWNRCSMIYRKNWKKKVFHVESLLLTVRIYA